MPIPLFYFSAKNITLKEQHFFVSAAFPKSAVQSVNLINLETLVGRGLAPAVLFVFAHYHCRGG